MRRVLVTGASGFVGANLARRLVSEGYDVHLLVRPNYAAWRIQDLVAHVKLWHADLTDQESVARTVAMVRPEWVFHLAAYGAYPSQTDTRKMVETNLLGTINFVDACLRAGAEAIVNTGTSSEYGFQDHGPAESEPVEPNSHYAVSKAAATLFCQFTARSRKAHLPTLRLYSAYGPFEEPTRLMPTLIVSGLVGSLPPLAGPAVARDYVYSEDVTEAYLLAAATPSQEQGAIYNVGTGVQTTLKCVVDLAREELSIRADPHWGSLPDRQWDTAVWVANNDKIRRVLGWSPRYSLEDGFRAMVSWFREHPDLRAHYRNPTSKP